VTFFLTGIFARKFPDSVRKIAAAGHEIANHSDTHPDFTKLSDAEVVGQLQRAEKALLPLAGRAYVPLFRPPYGGRNVRVLRLIARQGFLPVYWTVDTLDWREDATSANVLARLKKGVKNGAVLLQHAASAASVEGLPQELDLFRQLGLEPIPVSGLLRR
jgi:peptidoglycan/xylan/chitin deacetylase (PgdA/CDA1 family)